MDDVIAFLSGVAALWTAAGEHVARYPLVLVLGAHALGVTLAVLAGSVAAGALHRRRPAWPWRTHLAALVVVVGGTTVLHLDARMTAVTGGMRRLQLDERMGVIEGAGRRETTGRVGARLIDQAGTSARLAEILPGCEVAISRLESGVEFATVRAREPSPSVSYVAVVDLTHPGIRIEITGGMQGKSLTSAFARERGCIVAINGEAGVTPAFDAPLGRYTGNWIANGVPVLLEDTARRPFLAFDRANRARYVPAAIVDTEPGPDKFNVIWGRGDVLRDGEVVARERKRWMRADPRTLMGVDAAGERLILMVVDGRQPGFSTGLELSTAGAVLGAFGATDGMWCDQGGSSTMALGCLDGVVNQPCDGLERAVYAHFGIARD